MKRIFVVSVLGAIVVAALLYGVVLNGFGLFGETSSAVQMSASEKSAPAETSAVPKSNKPGTQTSAVAAGQSDKPDATGNSNHVPTESGPSDSAHSQSVPVETARVARDVTPPNVLSRPTSRYVDPAIIQANKPEDSEQPKVRRYHRVIVRDARALESGDVTIRLAGVSPITADKICTDEKGHSWPCGRAATAALRMLIRQRAVDCTVVQELPDGILGTCSMGLQDINGWLVEQGWAEADPANGDAADYADEADSARNEKRGIYLAEWTPNGTGGTGSVPQQAFTAPAIPAEPYTASVFSDPAQGAIQGPAN